LISQCLAVPVDLETEQFSALVRWISIVEAHELIMSSSDGALALFGGVLRA